MSLPFYQLNTHMDIKELESFKLSDAVKFHDELNPELWTSDGQLIPEVYDKLMVIAKDFMSELGLSSLKVDDITISGSNAAYSYTPYSDLDLHILVDYMKLPDNEIYKELFNAKKTVYNDNHDISVNGVPVELYVQDSNQTHHSIGEYSLLNKDWIKRPTKRRANFDQSATQLKYEKLGELIELAIKTKSINRIEKVLDIVKRYRQAGLDKHGEFGPENLAYKALRNTGLIQQLWDTKQELHSEKLSLEDYHPNATPPGPEFKPTMPKGTVRVDVSDVYDWYKLGQHISNMKGLGKHDFGKGPPSTILSFGDEDLEHKYIDALKKTGLDTTDIDPKAHDMKKGQKVDPTYNVNEILDTEPSKSNKAKWDFSDPDMQELNFTASNGQQYRLDFLAPYIGPDEINQYNLLPDASDKYLDRGFFVQFEQVNKRSPWKKGKQGIEGTGAAAEIFGIVSNAILQFVKKKKPTYLYFQAAENNRISLYSAMVKRLLPSLPGWKSQGPSSDGVFTLYSPIKKVTKESSGYIPSEKEKNDPRFKTALTDDVKPDSIKKNAKAFGFVTSRAGIPPNLNPSGKYKGIKK